MGQEIDPQVEAEKAASRTRSMMTHPSFTDANLPTPSHTEEPDGLYYKYRIFREPENGVEHPVGLDCTYTTKEGVEALMDEVREFVFVLKPDSDHHARVALAAYAWSVREDKPALAEDLFEILRDF